MTNIHNVETRLGVVETANLALKISRWQHFIETCPYLDTYAKIWLYNQLIAMREYKRILRERIHYDLDAPNDSSIQQ